MISSILSNLICRKNKQVIQGQIGFHVIVSVSPVFNFILHQKSKSLFAIFL